jgi:hypothetical protein
MNTTISTYQFGDLLSSELMTVCAKRVMTILTVTKAKPWCRMF